MTRVEQKPAVAGVIGTVLIWFLIFLFFYISSIVFAPKQFKTIKIRLDSPAKNEKLVKKDEKTKTENAMPKTETAPVQEKSAEQNSAPASEAQQSSSQTVQKSSQAAEPVKKQTESKAAKNKEAEKKSSAKTESRSEHKNEGQPKIVEQQLVQSMDELLALQRAKTPAPKKKSAEEMWAELEAMEGNTSSSQSSVKKTFAVSDDSSAFSGSAASLSNSEQASQSARSNNSKLSASQKASEATMAALAGAVSAQKFQSAGGEISANTGKSERGKVMFQSADGRLRELIKPAVPRLDLSEKAQNIAMNYPHGPYPVKFTVRPDGTVDFGSISISGTLPLEIQTELKDQLKDWLFSPASYSGYVEFNYSMKKK